MKKASRGILINGERGLSYFIRVPGCQLERKAGSYSFGGWGELFK